MLYIININIVWAIVIWNRQKKVIYWGLMHHSIVVRPMDQSSGLLILQDSVNVECDKIFKIGRS